MVIRASSGKEISALIADLSSERAVAREGAVARLTIIGSRAGGPLAALAASAAQPAAARAAALRVLEATADPRGLEAGLAAIDDPQEDVATAAIDAVRPHLRGRRGTVPVDRLTRIAMDRGRTAPVRIAAVRALVGLEPSSTRPLLEALKDDPVAEIAAVASRAPGRSADASPLEDPAIIVSEAAEGRLPAQPDTLRRAIAREGQRVPLTTALAIVERVRARETTAGPAERVGWMAARAAAHVALARRNSRLALYDLRESLERAKEPLPVEFLAAIGAIGDRSCLEPIAAAYAAAKRPRDGWWRAHLSDAFRAIAAREKVTRRHAVIRKLEQRSPEVLAALWSGAG